MSESKQEKIDRLLREGLDHYGMDEVGSAILAWEAILEIEPDHVEAKDYVQTADRRSRPRGPKDSNSRNGTEDAVLSDARSLLRAGQVSEAYQLMSAAVQSGPTSLEFEAGFELARSRLYCEIRARIGSLSGVPSVRAGEDSLRGYNLPPNAGFLLSIVDGMTPLSDLISVSGMDAFDTLYTIEGLMEAGLVEVAS